MIANGQTGRSQKTLLNDYINGDTVQITLVFLIKMSTVIARAAIYNYQTTITIFKWQFV